MSLYAFINFLGTTDQNKMGSVLGEPKMFFLEKVEKVHNFLSPPPPPHHHHFLDCSIIFGPY